MKNINSKSLAVDVQGLAASNEKQVCCICGKVYDGFGNNPYPYKKSGRCCDQCNRDYVIPSRIMGIRLRGKGASEREVELAIRRYRQTTQAAMN